MCLIVGRQKVYGQEVRQNVCLPLHGCRWQGRSMLGFMLAPDYGKYGILWVCLYKPLQNVTRSHFLGARVYHPGQYLIKTCFKFGSKIVVVILFLIDGINSMFLSLSKRAKLSSCGKVGVRPIAVSIKQSSTSLLYFSYKHQLR